MPVDTNSMRDLVNSNNPVRPDGWSRSTLPNSFATIVAPSIPRPIGRGTADYVDRRPSWSA